MAPEPEAPSAFPEAITSVTHLLVAADLERSIRWYHDVLRAEPTGTYPGSAVFRIAGTWLLVVEGGPPTADKPTVTFAPPADPDRVTTELILAVPDCHAAYEELRARGADFLTPPVTYPWEVRAFFRDPDGHLFEITERRRSSD
jgi:catechol 2,3-dioxygenase-like lactoylglutathione lyase family enzyme